MLIPTTTNLKDTTKDFSDAVFANNSNSSVSACSLPQATTTDRLTDFVRVAGLRHKAWWGAASMWLMVRNFHSLHMKSELNLGRMIFTQQQYSSCSALSCMSLLAKCNHMLKSSSSWVFVCAFYFYHLDAETCVNWFVESNIYRTLAD